MVNVGLATQDVHHKKAFNSIKSLLVFFQRLSPFRFFQGVVTFVTILKYKKMTTVKWIGIVLEKLTYQNDVFICLPGEDGAVYIFYGGSSFPLGPDALSKCGATTLVTPCPAHLVRQQGFLLFFFFEP